MEMFTPVLLWYIMLFILGLIFTPITRKIFHSFYDFGYPFAKTIALLVLTYALFLLSTLHVLRFDMIGIIVVITIATFVNFKYFRSSESTPQKKLIFLIIEEVVFLFSFIAWAYIRSKQPDIRGLEKFMDYGFMNSVMRGPFLPAKDMWLAGSTINYYYFGHIVGAFLTKLSQIPGYVSYNLILATIFALSITQTFSLAFNIAHKAFKKNFRMAALTGILGTFIVNLGGNLHTIYAFTKGYNPDKTLPFWQLEAKYVLTDLLHPREFLESLSVFYWYPNATRFIPLTIHEFPLYSYVVADLHGHVFDIPFVLLTIAALYIFFTSHEVAQKFDIRHLFKKLKGQTINYIWPVAMGFLISVHYMTNAFDAIIYLLLTGVVFFVVFAFSRNFLINMGLIVVSFVIFSLPFNLHFDPFSSSIGVNCAPAALVKMGSFGPFIFEQAKCQISDWWMLVTLWGFFWFNFIALALYKLRSKREVTQTELFVFILFFVGTVLIIIPEFIYAKDIYPSHFRANTMFKLGYQAFIMMGLASAFVFTTLRRNVDKEDIVHKIFMVMWVPLFILIAIYPNFAINSYYGNQPHKPTLDGSTWLTREYPEYKEVIDYFNSVEIPDDTVILEAQGDSYTDYDVVSAYTGIPTVAGWHVHQWLWRGKPEVVGDLIPDIRSIYLGRNISETTSLLKKFKVSYVIVGPNENARYPELYEEKFEALGQLIFESSNKKARVYKIPLDSI